MRLTSFDKDTECGADNDIVPFSGFGLGLRSVHYEDYLKARQPLDFLEIISENYMVEGGRALWTLDRLRDDYPILMHGVSMSLGSADGLRSDYLKRLKRLADRIEPLWISDHLCWTGVHGRNSHDLLPLPLTDAALDRVASHIHQAQEYLERPLLIENPSTYLSFPEDSYREWEFLSALCDRTGCYLLLDLNNIVVSAHNHGFSSGDYLDGLPLSRVRQIHLAGHTDTPDLKIDTHDQPIGDDVWRLLGDTLPRLGPVALMIERDDHIPPLEVLLAELDQARQICSAPVAA